MNKVIIWGTGTIARHFFENGINGCVMGFVETHKTVDGYMGLPLYSIDELPDGYDYIVVANMHANEIYYTCLQKGIDLEKVIFLRGVKNNVGFQDLTVIHDILGEKNYTNYCAEYSLMEDSFFQKDKEQYVALNTRENFQIEEHFMWPIIKDKYDSAGTANNYFWQDLWAAKLIYQSGVKTHFDIGSRVDGFIAHLLAMDIEVTLIDIREFPVEVEHLHTLVDDATSLRQVEDASIDSMSALCSLEHFGLGRYGDPIDPEACFKCFAEIQKKIKCGGHLYIAVPIGKERIEFNAHRVFYAETIVKEFDQMKLLEYSCTADGRIEYDVDIHKYDDDKHNGNYRYGLFHFVK